MTTVEVPLRRDQTVRFGYAVCPRCEQALQTLSYFPAGRPEKQEIDLPCCACTAAPLYVAMATVFSGEFMGATKSKELIFRVRSYFDAHFPTRHGRFWVLP